MSFLIKRRNNFLAFIKQQESERKVYLPNTQAGSNTKYESYKMF